MLLEEYNLKLMQLRKIYDRLDEECAEITEEIDDLEIKQTWLEDTMLNIEKKILSVKKQMTNARKEELNYGTEDKFKINFIKASLFANEDESRDPLYGVRITKDKIMASDGWKGVIIKCDCIPEDLKNTRIKWDVRDNFNDNIIDSGEEFYDLEKLFEQYKESKKYTVDKVGRDNFYELFKSQLVFKDEELEKIELEYKELEIAFNKELVDLALMCMEDKEFTVHLTDNKSPMILEHDEISAIIMPMRK